MVTPSSRTGRPSSTRPRSAAQVQEVAESTEHKYNDDLLATPGDRQAAAQLFPEIIHILDHPQLRVEFTRYNLLANNAKWWVHTIGLTAVVFAAVALLSSAATPIIRTIESIPDLNQSTRDNLCTIQSGSLVFEILGLVGAAVALGGLWISNWKKQWLQGRLMTEKLRAWHFQTLIHRGEEIERSCDASDPRAVATFQQARERWFVAFLQEHDGKLDSQLHALIESAESQYESLHDGRSDYPGHSQALPVVFKAYRALRLKHQADYAAHKLKRNTSEPFWKPHRWPTIVLKERLNALSSCCIGGALLTSAYVVLAFFLQWPLADSPAMPAVSLCLLVLSVTARGIMDGLAVREESQRYVDYAGEVRYLLTRFECMNQLTLQR